MDLHNLDLFDFIRMNNLKIKKDTLLKTELFNYDPGKPCIQIFIAKYKLTMHTPPTSRPQREEGAFNLNSDFGFEFIQTPPPPAKF